MSVKFGIDFGTTNTATVKVVDDKYGVRYENIGYPGDIPIPTVIALNKKTGEISFGMDAKEIRNEANPDFHTFSSLKSYLDQEKPLVVSGKVWSPIKLTTEFFKKLKEYVRAKSVGNYDIEEAVIAIPVDSSHEQRKNLLKAANNAGIKVSKFISEPTAAYFKYKEEVKGYSKVAVFDWGGGTLDISILENKQGQIYELSVHGARLGGNDIDYAIAEAIHNDLVSKTGINISFEEMEDIYRNKLLSKAEDAKIDLCHDSEALISLFRYGQFGNQNLYLREERMYELIKPLIIKAYKVLDECLKKAGLVTEQLGCILMVGGSSKIKPIRLIMEEACKKANIKVIYPDDAQWSIADGAAKVALSKSGYRLNSDVGILLSDNTIYKIFERGEAIPSVKHELSLALVEDNRIANFILVDSKMKTIKRIPIKAKGFLEETFKVVGEIDSDLIAKVTIGSGSFDSNTHHTEEIRGLSFYYNL
ncbi:MAG TPA: Hsp70 family protein [Patescibacteria group bacterium]|nr:Hsp70 family protein [Patescibacteria group bacterium]